MRVRSICWTIAGSALAAVLSFGTPAAIGQGQAPSGKAQHLTTDGQPDIQGVWRPNPGGDTYDLTGNTGPRPDYLLQGDGKPKQPTRRVVDPPDGVIPYQPWAAAKQKEIQDNVDNPTKPQYVDTQAHCLLEAPFRILIHSGFQILQAPGYVLFFSEANDEYRIVPLDGHPHVGQDIKLWQGDSRGHWEGNTLVIDDTNLKAKSRLDMVGNFYSPAVHLVERFTVADDKTINYEVTVTDPSVYTKPWKLTVRFLRNSASGSGYEVYESPCHEGERSSERMAVPAGNSNKDTAGTKVSQN
jgi:hypothetical protein